MTSSLVYIKYDIVPFPIDEFPLSLDMYIGDVAIPTIVKVFCVNIGLLFSSKSLLLTVICFPIKLSMFSEIVYLLSNKHSFELVGNFPYITSGLFMFSLYSIILHFLFHLFV